MCLEYLHSFVLLPNPWRASAAVWSGNVPWLLHVWLLLRNLSSALKSGDTGLEPGGFFLNISLKSPSSAVFLEMARWEGPASGSRTPSQAPLCLRFPKVQSAWTEHYSRLLQDPPVVFSVVCHKSNVKQISIPRDSFTSGVPRWEENDHPWESRAAEAMGCSEGVLPHPPQDLYSASA